jgi:4,5-DOPA dioxygenase extradiol
VGTLPAVFVSHGAPTMYLEAGPTHSFLSNLGGQLGRPEAILCVSAHWEAARPTLGASRRPETIHDFGGFGDALGRVVYPAPGDPALARRAANLLGAAGLPARTDDARGLDHGAWVPLGLMYPAADVPVVQLSVQPDLGARHHLELGRALAPLRREGVLLLGSGGGTHDLRGYFNQPDASPPPAHVAAFEQWLCGAVTDGDVDALVDYEAQGPGARRNHPTAEHFLPFFVPLGAAGDPHGRILHRAFDHGVLSLAAFAWD